MRDVFIYDGCIIYNGQFSYIADVSRNACRRMHTYGSFEIAGTHITGLLSNQTASCPIVLTKHVNNGICLFRTVGAMLIPILMEIEKISLGSLKITLQDYIVDVRTQHRKHKPLLLRSGVICELSSTHCIEGGDPVSVDHCRASDYSVLYNGYTNKILDQ